jgi:hypothetical protein
MEVKIMAKGNFDDDDDPFRDPFDPDDDDDDSGNDPDDGFDPDDID